MKWVWIILFIVAGIMILNLMDSLMESMLDRKYGHTWHDSIIYRITRIVVYIGIATWVIVEWLR